MGIGPEKPFRIYCFDVRHVEVLGIFYVKYFQVTTRM